MAVVLTMIYIYIYCTYSCECIKLVRSRDFSYVPVKPPGIKHWYILAIKRTKLFSSFVFIAGRALGDVSTARKRRWWLDPEWLVFSWCILAYLLPRVDSNLQRSHLSSVDETQHAAHMVSIALFIFCATLMVVRANHLSLRLHSTFHLLPRVKKSLEISYTADFIQTFPSQFFPWVL